MFASAGGSRGPATYMGAGACRRVLDGQVERGAASRLSAVVLLADLRDFTRLADDTPGEQLLVVLNDYPDVVLSPGGGRVAEIFAQDVDRVPLASRFSVATCRRKQPEGCAGLP